VRYIALFAGVAPHTAAFREIGWECVAFSEIEPFPCAVLAYRFPEIPNLGDIRKITEAQIKSLGHVDAVLFGFPCQDLSVAGKRAGLKTTDGKHTRSGLFFEAMRVVRISGARFALAENVPGLFSSNGGRDFAAVVGEMAGVDFDVPDGGWADSGVAIGPEGLVEWCVLDAQFFGLAQRRRRVFLIRDTGNWQRRRPLLLERTCLQGNPAPSRTTRKEFADGIRDGVAGSIGAHRTGGWGMELDNSGAFIPEVCAPELARFLSTSNERIELPEVCGTLSDGAHMGGGLNGQDAYTGRIIPVTAFSAKDHGADASEEVSPTLRAGGFDKSHANSGNWMAVAFSAGQSSEAGSLGLREEQSPTLRGAASGTNQVPAMMQGMAVRRLTPRECERLQGMSDDFTLIPWKGKNAPDGPRYKAIGNSWAVPVLTWIAKRINEVHRGGTN
jgi:DNA (cytosine-5)-methyltransferase 1